MVREWGRGAEEPATPKRREEKQRPTTPKKTIYQETPAPAPAPAPAKRETKENRSHQKKNSKYLISLIYYKTLHYKKILYINLM